MEYNNGIYEIIDSRRQHVNFSPSAYLTIQEDIRNFDVSGNITKTGFLNKIFQNYYESADASISIRKKAKIDSLIKIINDKSDNSKVFIDKMVDDYTKKLKRKIDSYQLGSSETCEKLRLDKKTQTILYTDQKLGSYEFEGSVGIYLKAIYEEYALKITYERERIFFKDTYDKILNAIANKRKVRITLYSKVNDIPNSYYVIPYKVLPNKANTYNYLVGYSTKDDGDKSYKTITSFRLSNIAHIQTSGNYSLNKAEIKRLEDELHKRSVEFMTGFARQIKIRLSDRGIKNFRKQIYMRPSEYEIDLDDDHIYTFSCTTKQIEYYFFKFGNDVEIIEPLELRKKFKNRYKNAYDLYID